MLDSPPGDPQPIVPCPECGLASSQDHTEPEGVWQMGRLHSGLSVGRSGWSQSRGQFLPQLKCRLRFLQRDPVVFLVLVRRRVQFVSWGGVGLGDRLFLLEWPQSLVTLIRGNLRKGGWGPL